MKKIIVGISGASGVIMGYELLCVLRNIGGTESHLVITEGAIRNFREETTVTPQELFDAADVYHPINDMAASIASGTFDTAGMIIIPCSMKTLAGVACGYSENLLLRAADVTLKESRPLVLITREAPLSLIHLKNMVAVKEAGGIILPPVLTFYNGADTVEKQIHSIIGKALKLFGLHFPNFCPWQGSNQNPLPF